MLHAGTGIRRFAFLITAAGSGSRMGGGEKKEFRLLDGKPVLQTTVENFLKSGLFSYGLVTCKPGTQSRTEALLEPLKPMMDGLCKPVVYCDGGEERQQSVFLGLQCLAREFPDLVEDGCVLIHDGARPWAGTELISRVVQGCMLHRGCAPAVPSVDAMKEISPEGIIVGHHPRSETVSIQTPQGFAFSEILAAHQRASADGRDYIDDTEIFSRYEGDVYTVPGDTANKKITYPADMEAGD